MIIEWQIYYPETEYMTLDAVHQLTGDLCQLAFQEAARKYIEGGKDLTGKGFDPRKLLAPGTDAIKVIVKAKIELFGSAGRA